MSSLRESIHKVRESRNLAKSCWTSELDFYICMYLGWEEVVVDVVGEAGHLLEPGAGAVLEHLAE